jgi:hypothetical protein
MKISISAIVYSILVVYVPVRVDCPVRVSVSQGNFLLEGLLR